MLSIAPHLFELDIPAVGRVLEGLQRVRRARRNEVDGASPFDFGGFTGAAGRECGFDLAQHAGERHTHQIDSCDFRVLAVEQPGGWAVCFPPVDVGDVLGAGGNVGLHGHDAALVIDAH